jgi:hypothetical protein
MHYQNLILTTAYLPPIQYFTKVVNSHNIIIEINETFAKQSYRNRCVILSCNGPLSLSIPVVKSNGNRTLTKDIRIDNSTNWQKNHWKAIESAYRNSVYFDFIADLISPYFSKKEQFLIDFNHDLMDDVLEFIGLRRKISNSVEYLKDYPDDIRDLRNAIHPKHQSQFLDDEFSPCKYFQVFNDRYSFYPNLSIVDLLFNEGLGTLKIIEDSQIKSPHLDN